MCPDSRGLMTEYYKISCYHSPCKSWLLLIYRNLCWQKKKARKKVKYRQRLCCARQKRGRKGWTHFFYLPNLSVWYGSEGAGGGWSRAQPFSFGRRGGSNQKRNARYFDAATEVNDAAWFRWRRFLPVTPLLSKDATLSMASFFLLFVLQGTFLRPFFLFALDVFFIFFFLLFLSLFPSYFCCFF